MLSLWVIRQSLHIDKIHKNDNLFLIIPTLHQNLIYVDIIAHVRSMRKETSSDIHTHGILSKCETFSPANQIDRNKHNDGEMGLLDEIMT